MKKYIIILIPLLIGCSFQVRESEGYEERLSRMPRTEERDIYSEFHSDEGFRGYEYEETLPLVDYSIDDRERFSRKSFFFDEDTEIRVSGPDEYNLNEYYETDALNYDTEDDLPEELRADEADETLKIE